MVKEMASCRPARGIWDLEAVPLEGRNIQCRCIDSAESISESNIERSSAEMANSMGDAAFDILGQFTVF
jgi:hypothetical protein